MERRRHIKTAPFNLSATPQQIRFQQIQGLGHHLPSDISLLPITLANAQPRCFVMEEAVAASATLPLRGPQIIEGWMVD